MSYYLLTSERPAWIPQDRHVKPDLSDPLQRQSETTSRAEGEHIHWSFSKSQIGKIEKDFTEKLRFLAWHGDIPLQYVGVISRLHEYRNEMYHREESRPEGLRIVAYLYASITATFLDLLWPRSYSWGPGSAETRRRLYERMNVEPPALQEGHYGSGRELQALMAKTLRRDLVLDDAPTLIGDYIHSRVERTHELLEYAREFTASMRGTEVSEMDTVRWAYWTPPGFTPTHKTPTRAMRKHWNEWAGETRQIPDPLEALQSLAEFESEFEPFEKKVYELATQVDLEVDRQIDEEKDRRAFRG
ncbi:hypothetical protein ACX80W_11430 [Arthrobacter sp. TMN-37]